MSLHRVRYMEIQQGDLLHIERACKSSYCGYGPTDILQGVGGLGLQLWRWGSVDEPHGGIIVTRIEQFPAGKQLFVLVCAGKGLLDQLPLVFAELRKFAQVENCTWIAGATEIRKLSQAFCTLKPVKRFEYLVYDAELPDVGLVESTRVKTPQGSMAAGALKVGDKVIGPDGVQTVAAVGRVSGRVVDARMGANTLVRGRDGSWRHASDTAASMGVGPVELVELTVTPDHVFTLADGTVVHNKGGSQPATTTTSNKPWWGQKEQLLGVYDQAKGDNSEANANQAFGPSVQDIISGYMGAAQGADAGASQLRKVGVDTASGKYLNPSSNEYLRGAMSAAIQPLEENFERSTLPAISDAAIGAGAYGGSRQGVAEALGANELNQTIGNITSNMAYQNYAQERQNQLNAGAVLGQANQLSAAPAQYLGQAYSAGQTLPFLGTQTWNGIVSGTPTFGSSTSTSQAAQASGGAQFLQGGLGGASTGAALGSVVPGLGTGIGAAIGGGVGALSSLF